MPVIVRAVFSAAFCCLMFWSAPAAAQSCSFSMTNMDWGNIDPTLDQVIDIAGTLTVSCSGIPAGGEIRICAHICQGSGGMHRSASPRYMLNGSSQLEFNIYRSNISTGVWGAGGSAANSLCGSSPGALNTVYSITATADSSGNYNTTVTAYGRIFAGQITLPAGTYISSFASTGTSRAVGTYEIFSTANCSAINSNATDFPFTATATVAPTCRVSATDLNFGTETLLASDVYAASTVSVTCTSGQNYAVGLNQGTTAGGTTTIRLMKHASSAATVPYEMYSNASRSQNWGNSTTDDAEGTGTGSTINHTVYGRVPAQVTAPQAGTYSDTVTVTVTY